MVIGVYVTAPNFSYIQATLIGTRIVINHKLTKRKVNKVD